jgi:hypothetical protein
MLLTNAQAQAKDGSVAGKNAIKKTSEPIPYSAEATSEAIETLNNGNKIKRTTKEWIFGDSKGRVRRESEHVFSNKTQKTINIRDPLAGFEYYLNPITKTAYRIPIKTFSPATQTVASAPTGFSTRSEPLEKKIIEGFETTGRRSITTIAAGTVGNEQPIESISETWYSPELRTIIFTKRSDPRMGNYTYEMKNIKRGEPDAALFSVPVDYKITEQGNVTDRYFTVETPQ